MKLPALIFALLLSLHVTMQADEPSGPKVLYPTPEAKPAEKETTHSYSVEITRESGDKKMAGLLKKAEATYPDRQEVLKAMEKDLRQKVDAKEPLWWWNSFDDVRVPYAITDGALDYYKKLIEAFKRDDFTSTHGLVMKQAELKYRSAINYYESWNHGKTQFHRVYVAEMSLNWSQYCGNVCAMDFHKERHVVFDSGGRIKAIFGDKAERFVVS